MASGTAIGIDGQGAEDLDGADSLPGRAPTGPDSCVYEAAAGLEGSLLAVAQNEAFWTASHPIANDTELSGA